MTAKLKAEFEEHKKEAKRETDQLKQEVEHNKKENAKLKEEMQ